MADKINLTDISNLQNETSVVAAINNNNSAIEAAIDNTLSRDGLNPNEMNSILDMNSNRIINLPAPVGDQDPVRVIDIQGTLDTLETGFPPPANLFSILDPVDTALDLIMIYDQSELEWKVSTPDDVFTDNPNPPVDPTSVLVNSLRAAEKTGSGVTADGTMFIDICDTVDTIDTVTSSNYEFKRGGIRATVSAQNATTVSTGTTSGNNTGWAGYTIVESIQPAFLSNTGKEYVRVTWRSGSSGTMNIHGAFIGALDSDGFSFKKDKPVVMLTFSGAADLFAINGATIVSDIVEYEVEAGEVLGISYYLRTNGTVATKTQAGWTSNYKVSTNEPSQFAKSGYSTTSTILGLEKIEAFSAQSANMTLRSKQLPLTAVPLQASVVVAVEIETADLSDLVFSLSRNGSSWSTVTLTNIYSFNNVKYLFASNHSLSGISSGSALYWRAVTSNNKDVKIKGVGVLQKEGTFTDITTPSISGEKQLTHHLAATGLGYDSGGSVLYGRLWGFTQDWEIKGPTRFTINLHVNLQHNGAPVAASPVAWTIPITTVFADTISALGARPVIETDTDSIGNNSFKWLNYDAGNITNSSEHYKTATLSFIYDVETPQAIRFEVWGYSATDADSPLVSGRISVYHVETFGFGYVAKSNYLDISAEPLR